MVFEIMPDPRAQSIAFEKRELSGMHSPGGLSPIDFGRLADIPNVKIETGGKESISRIAVGRYSTSTMRF